MLNLHTNNYNICNKVNLVPRFVKKKILLKDWMRQVAELVTGQQAQCILPASVITWVQGTGGNSDQPAHNVYPV